MANIKDWWRKITPWEEEEGETFGGYLGVPPLKGKGIEEAKKWWETEAAPRISPIVSDIGQWLGEQQPYVKPEPGLLTGWSPFGTKRGTETYPTPEFAPYEAPPADFQPAIDALTAPGPTPPEGGRTRVRSIGGWDVMETWDPTTGEWVLPIKLGRTMTPEEEVGLTEYQREEIRLTEERAAADQASQLQRLALDRERMQRESERHEQQLALQKQQELARLAAQPHSWLEYAALAEEAPVVQPWMLPLMSQEYTGAAGEPIPGWGAESMKGMPALTRPSRQYQARMGPTALAQYGGYRQARTGIRPEETEFRLWSQAPPGGQHRGLTRQR